MLALGKSSAGCNACDWKAEMAYGVLSRLIHSAAVSAGKLPVAVRDVFQHRTHTAEQ